MKTAKEILDVIFFKPETPQEKATEYLSEFSKEKSIDMAETMRDYAKEFNYTEWVYFWNRVIKILSDETINSNQK